MAEPFKNSLGPKQVKALSAGIARAWPAFDAREFERRAVRGLEALELKARAQHVGDALAALLPSPRGEALRVVARALRDMHDTGFVYFPLSSLLERHGPDDFDAALEANYELTKRFTAEFSIRALLLADEARALAALKRWVADESEHVRRLVSEGTRPRLPWGCRLPMFQRDPSPVLALLERLKDDPSEYVRRSVANNLNDIAKDNPDVVLATCRRWLVGASKERRRLVEHALRSLVKKGDPRALALFGARGAKLGVKASVTPARVRLGEKVTIAALVKNGSRSAAHVVVDARVHFVKRRGPSVKVFKLGRADLEAGARTTISRSFTMQHRSIRELHAGRHAVEVQVNGRVVRAGAFELVVTSRAGG